MMMSSLKKQMTKYLTTRFGSVPDDDCLELCLDIYRMGMGGVLTPQSKPKTIVKPTWRTDKAIYDAELLQAWEKFKLDAGTILILEQYHPKLNILLTIEKAINTYWITEAGYIRKKRGRGEINWKRTFINALDLRFNWVFKPVAAQMPSGRGFTV